MDDDFIDVEIGNISDVSNKEKTNKKQTKQKIAKKDSDGQTNKDLIVVNDDSHNNYNVNNSDNLFSIQKKSSKLPKDINNSSTIEKDKNKKDVSGDFDVDISQQEVEDNNNSYSSSKAEGKNKVSANIHKTQSPQGSPKRSPNKGKMKNEVFSESLNNEHKSNLSQNQNTDNIQMYSRIEDKILQLPNDEIAKNNLSSMADTYKDYENILKSLELKKNKGEKLTKRDIIDIGFKKLLEGFQEVLSEEEHFMNSQKSYNEEKIINTYAKQNTKLLHLLSQLNIFINSLIDLSKITPSQNKKKNEQKKKKISTDSDVKIAYLVNNDKIENNYKMELEKLTERFNIVSQPEYLEKCADIIENLDKQIKDMRMENKSLQKSNTISENKNSFRMKNYPTSNHMLESLDFDYTSLRRFNDNLSASIQKKNILYNDRKEIIKVMEEENQKLMDLAREDYGITETDLIKPPNDDSEIKLKLINLLKKHSVCERQLASVKKKIEIDRSKNQKIISELQSKIDNSKFLLNEKNKFVGRKNEQIKNYYKLYNQNHFDLIYSNMPQSIQEEDMSIPSTERNSFQKIIRDRINSPFTQNKAPLFIAEQNLRSINNINNQFILLDKDDKIKSEEKAEDELGRGALQALKRNSSRPDSPKKNHVNSSEKYIDNNTSILIHEEVTPNFSSLLLIEAAACNNHS